MGFVLAVTGMCLVVSSATSAAFAQVISESEKLVADDDEQGDHFGEAVATNGGVVVVGTSLDDFSAGAAYIFDVLTGAQLHRLIADPRAQGDQFGESVAIEGQTILIGASLDDDNGAAYLFDATTGVQIAKLTASDDNEDKGFGSSVSLSGRTAVVGAFKDNSACPGVPVCFSGAAYLFRDTAGPSVAVGFAPLPLPAGEDGALTGTADDTDSGDSNIVDVEYRIDGGAWESVLTPVDGLYDEPTCVDIQVDVPDATVRLRAIEVTQVIQDWRNSIPLCHEKPTVVRVVLEGIDSSSPPTGQGRLHGSVGGVPLEHSPLPSEQSQVDLEDDVTVVDDPDTVGTNESVRGRVDGSLIFVLPPGWTNPTAAPVMLEFEITGPGDQYLECAEPDGSPDCAVGVQFEDVPAPKLAMVAVPYDRNEIRELTVTATGGNFLLGSEGNDSDPLLFDANSADVEDAVEDVLNARDGRVVVSGGGDSSPRTYTIVTMRGQSEELTIDDSGLSGTASLIVSQLGGPEIRPSDEQLQEQGRHISDNFPISFIDRRLTDINSFNRAPTVIKVNTRLQKVRSLGLILGDCQLEAKSFGYMIGGWIPEPTRSGQAWVKVASSYSLAVEGPQDGGRFRNLSAHETAHTYGRAHAVTRADPTGFFRSGVCGSHGHIHSPVLHPWVSALTYDILAQRIHGSFTRSIAAERRGSDAEEFALVAGAINPSTGEASIDPLIRATGTDPGFDAGEVHVALVDDNGVELSARDVALLEDGNDQSLSYGTGPIMPGFFASHLRQPIAMGEQIQIRHWSMHIPLDAEMSCLPTSSNRC